MSSQLTDMELGWLAGLLEGEAHFDYGAMSQRVKLGMADEDTVLRVAAVIYKLTGKMPTVSSEEPRNKNHSTIFRFAVSGETARIVMRAVVPHMSYRRRRRIWQALNKYKEVKQSVTAADLVKLVVNNG
jgi:hypothetical protein